jgi:cell wall assembly regulator SMI1
MERDIGDERVCIQRLLRVWTDPRAVTNEVLDAGLLAQLEDRWRACGAPVADALRPGLIDDEMDALTAPLGIHLPAEARRWWGWHDGANAKPGYEAPHLGPQRPLYPLARAVEVCITARDTQRHVFRDHDPDPDAPFGPYWSPSWLPLTGQGEPVVLDCSVSVDAPVPVRTFIFEEPTVTTPGLQSIRELVSIWIEAFDSHAWTHDPLTRRWRWDGEKLEPEVLRLHLA